MVGGVEVEVGMDNAAVDPMVAGGGSGLDDVAVDCMIEVGWIGVGDGAETSVWSVETLVVVEGVKSDGGMDNAGRDDMVGGPAAGCIVVAVDWIIGIG